MTLGGGIVIGLFFPGTPMLLLGVALARFQARSQYGFIRWLREKNRRDEEAYERAFKAVKRWRKMNAKLGTAATNCDPQLQLNMWT